MRICVVSFPDARSFPSQEGNERERALGNEKNHKFRLFIFPVCGIRPVPTFCSSECAHAQFTMQARVVSSPGQRIEGGLGTIVLGESEA